MDEMQYAVRSIGHVCSDLKSLADAPRQGNEGAPRARIEVDADVAEGLSGLRAGDEVIVLTWFHLARRDVLKLHPRGGLYRNRVLRQRIERLG
jgi:tRNA (Thr-GGU) A37 N-methylase